MFVRAIARPLLASWFVYASVDALLDPTRHARKASPAIEPLLEDAGVSLTLPQLVRAHSAATLVAATSLALSRTPALGRARPRGPRHRSPSRPPSRSGARRTRTRAPRAGKSFLKNISLLGGALLAATAGKPHRRKKSLPQEAPQVSPTIGTPGFGPGQLWDAPAASAPLDATVAVPGSKSLTNRYLVLAALAAGPVTIRGALRSRDSQLMVDALRQFGVTVDDAGDEWAVTPPARLRGRRVRRVRARGHGHALRPAARAPGRRAGELRRRPRRPRAPHGADDRRACARSARRRRRRARRPALQGHARARTSPPRSRSTPRRRPNSSRAC